MFGKQLLGVNLQCAMDGPFPLLHVLLCASKSQGHDYSFTPEVNKYIATMYHKVQQYNQSPSGQRKHWLTNSYQRGFSDTLSMSFYLSDFALGVSSV